MTAAVGRSLVLLSLLFAATGSVVAFAAFLKRRDDLTRLAARLVYAHAAAMTLANAWMVVALLRPDFSISYVAQVGSRDLPRWVQIVSLWSSLEGSILFWGLVLALFLAGTTRALDARHEAARPAAIGVWLVCATFFAFLIAGPAQPFGTVVDPPADGPGPNPLLQNHVLMAIHPPFLYGGYVGMTIPFGLAFAALLVGRVGPALLSTIRTSLLLPWVSLTIAIVLGGYWAYEVLGWGGYWAWDPVENASLLPWLTATAALHSAILSERRGALRGWTMSLILATFLLTVLGTFMTRSGVFNSVHSFTQSAIGPTILVFLGFATALSVIALALRVDLLRPDGELARGLSRDTAFLAQNLLFVLLTFTVLVGTVFPLVVEAARGVQMSVGRPYFDRMTAPLGIALLFLMGVGPSLPWGGVSSSELRARLAPPLAAGVLAGIVGLAFGVRDVGTLLTLVFAGYTAHATLREALRPAIGRARAAGLSTGAALRADLAGPGLRRLSGYVAHAGAILAFISIAVSSTRAQSVERELREGESLTVAGYTLTFQGVDAREEVHRSSLIAKVAVSRGGRDLGVLEPRMNQYRSQREAIGTPAVRTGLFEDLYLSAMHIDPERGSLGLLAMVNPLVSWLWIATVVMAAGGLLALWASSRAARATP